MIEFVSNLGKKQFHLSFLHLHAAFFNHSIYLSLFLVYNEVIQRESRTGVEELHSNMFSNSLMVMKDGSLLCAFALVLCFGVQLYNIEETERKHRNYYVKVSIFHFDLETEN
jgi:hypothetical protein